MGVTVALETATATCSVAVADDDGRVLAEIVAPRGPAHTRRLLPDLHHAMDMASAAGDEIDSVVVGIGPGTFTGLRIGVATARALAQASDARLIGVPSLTSLGLRLAECDARQAVVSFVALIDGKRREVFAACFHRAAGAAGLAVDRPLCTVVADELTGFLADRPGAVVGGDGAHLYADRLPETVVLSDVGAPTAGMALRAWRREAPGIVEGPAETVPIYGRRPDAARWTSGKGQRRGGGR